jgi:hypothetical protein
MKLKRFNEYINESVSDRSLLRLINLGLAELPIRIEYYINTGCTRGIWKLLKTPVELRDDDWLDEFHLASETWSVAHWEEVEGSSKDPVLVKHGRVQIASLIADDELKWFGPKITSEDEFEAEVNHRARAHIIKIAQDLERVPVLITEEGSGVWYSVESGIRLN